MPTLSLESTVCISDQQVACELEGESVVLHLASGQYFGLDDVGTRIWDLVQKPILISQLVGELQQEYDVDANQCEQQVLSFLMDLQKHEMIELVNAKTA